MQEIPFSIPITGVVRIDKGSISIIVNRAETAISFEAKEKEKRILLEKGQTLFDIVLETAKELVRRESENRFSAAQLYGVALKRIPNLKRNSWGSHVIASSGNHPSQQYYGSKRDYFRYLGDGTYSLKDIYINQSKRTINKQH